MSIWASDYTLKDETTHKSLHELQMECTLKGLEHTVTSKEHCLLQLQTQKRLYFCDERYLPMTYDYFIRHLGLETLKPWITVPWSIVLHDLHAGSQPQTVMTLFLYMMQWVQTFGMGFAELEEACIVLHKWHTRGARAEAIRIFQLFAQLVRPLKLYPAERGPDLQPSYQRTGDLCIRIDNALSFNSTGEMFPIRPIPHSTQLLIEETLWRLEHLGFPCAKALTCMWFHAPYENKQATSTGIWCSWSTGMARYHLTPSAETVHGYLSKTQPSKTVWTIVYSHELTLQGLPVIQEFDLTEIRLKQPVLHACKTEIHPITQVLTQLFKPRSLVQPSDWVSWCLISLWSIPISSDPLFHLFTHIWDHEHGSDMLWACRLFLSYTSCDSLHIHHTSKPYLIRRLSEIRQLQDLACPFSLSDDDYYNLLKSYAWKLPMDKYRDFMIRLNLSRRTERGRNILQLQFQGKVMWARQVQQYYFELSKLEYDPFVFQQWLIETFPAHATAFAERVPEEQVVNTLAKHMPDLILPEACVPVK